VAVASRNILLTVSDSSSSATIIVRLWVFCAWQMIVGHGVNPCPRYTIKIVSCIFDATAGNVDALGCPMFV